MVDEPTTNESPSVPSISYEEMPEVHGPASVTPSPVPPAHEQNPVSETHAAPVPQVTPPNELEHVAPAAHEEPPVHHDVLPSPPPPMSAPKERHGFFRFLGTLVFIVILFGLGIWLSSQLRSYFAGPLPEVANSPTPVAYPTSGRVPVASISATPAAWQTYQVVNGTTRAPITGFSYQLPGGVTAPVCDSGGCPSQGTNLPGGTRLTVAARGKGQVLPDFRGAILTDINGKEFVMKQAIVGGLPVYEYDGDFTGRTSGGYSFTKMRGVLVAVSDTFAVDFNHFAPVGSTSDFAADDRIFDQIIASIKMTNTVSKPTPTQPTYGIGVGTTPTVTPSATTAATPTP